MRLDKYLKVSRLIKRRTVANEACDGERVSVNGKVARASYEVKVGDVIEIRFGERTLKVKVAAVTSIQRLPIYEALQTGVLVIHTEYIADQ